MKYWDSENNDTFTMQFGHGMSPKKNNKNYTHKRKYYYPDKRTKKYGAQRLELLKNAKKND